MKPTIRTPYNHTELGVDLEEIDPVSQTSPDQSMSLQEILSRYSQNLPLTADGRIPIWHGEDEYLPDFHSLDLAEQEAIMDQARAEVAEAKEKLRKYHEARSKPADQGPNVQRTTGDADDHGSKDQPDPQYPKKARGAGAEPRDTRSTRNSEYYDPSKETGS